MMNSRWEGVQKNETLFGMKFARGMPNNLNLSTAMKVFFTLLLFIGISFTGFGQEDDYTRDPNEKIVPAEAPIQMFFGPSSGLNNKVGFFGASFGIPVENVVVAGGGLGLGTWGFKGTAYAQYYPFDPTRSYRGTFFEMGYSSAFGVEGVETELELANGRTETVLVDYNQVSLLNTSVGYAFKMGKKSRYRIQAGYSFRFNGNTHYTLEDPNIELSSNTKSALRLLTPGGVILSMSLNFGI